MKNLTKIDIEKGIIKKIVGINVNNLNTYIITYTIENINYQIKITNKNQLSDEELKLEIYNRLLLTEKKEFRNEFDSNIILNFSSLIGQTIIQSRKEGDDSNRR